MLAEINFNLTESFKSNIVHHNKEILQNFLTDPEFKNQVLVNGMEFLSVICDNVEENMIDFNNHDDVYCNLINFIAENGNPKEVICILNVHLFKTKLDFKFLILLYPLSVALQKLDASSISTSVILKDSLTSAISYFKSLPVAHYKGLEGEELEVYIQTSETQRYLRLSKTYLGFLESMISNIEFIKSNLIKTEILRNILILFDCSLIKLVFYSPGIVAEECRSCSLRTFNLIEQLVGCMHSFILDMTLMNSKIQEQVLANPDDENIIQLKDDIIPNSSLVCLLYHIFVRQFYRKYPQIFTSIYNWSFSIPILSKCLCDSTDPHAIRLCLQLLDEFDHRIEVSSIPWKMPILQLFTSLKIAMTSNFNQEIRAFSHDIFVRTFSKLMVKGRFKLLKHLLKDTDHFGYKGQLILLLKKEILEALSQNNIKDKYFIGSSVYPLISEIFTLPDGDKTDIVNESEWILAALNMLYVLLNRDKRHLVGIDVLINDFQKDFLKPLTKATEMSLGHYNNERRLVEAGESASMMNELNDDLGFMDKTQKMEFIDKAILMIELVRCSVSRITNML